MALNIKDFPKYEAEFAAAGKDAAKIQRAIEKYSRNRPLLREDPFSRPGFR